MDLTGIYEEYADFIYKKLAHALECQLVTSKNPFPKPQKCDTIFTKRISVR